jgi:hypothetical protein
LCFLRLFCDFFREVVNVRNLGEGALDEVGLFEFVDGVGAGGGAVSAVNFVYF